MHTLRDATMGRSTITRLQTCVPFGPPCTSKNRRMQHEASFSPYTLIPVDRKREKNENGNLKKKKSNAGPTTTVNYCAYTLDIAYRSCYNIIHTRVHMYVLWMGVCVFKTKTVCTPRGVRVGGEPLCAFREETRYRRQQRQTPERPPRRRRRKGMVNGVFGGIGRGQ